MQVFCWDTFSNPPANRKQASLISLNTKSVEYGKNRKTTPSYFFGLDLHVISTKARSISWNGHFIRRDMKYSYWCCICQQQTMITYKLYLRVQHMIGRYYVSLKLEQKDHQECHILKLHISCWGRFLNNINNLKNWQRTWDANFIRLGAHFMLVFHSYISMDIYIF